MNFQPDSVRYFNGPGECLHYAGMALSGVITAVIVPSRHHIQRSFGEKIMLAVTGVNQCRHCSFLHSQLSLEQGISADEITDLLAGNFDNIHPDEAPAVVYAQHWADTSGRVSDDARQRLQSFYGPEKTKQIEAYIRTVYFGNMSCNTRDAYREAQVSEKRSPAFLMAYIMSLVPATFVTVAGKLKASSAR